MWLIISILFLLYTNYVERRKFHLSLYTPMNLLCLPTLVLMILSYPQEMLVGYYAVSQGAVLIFLYCIVFFYIGGCLCLVTQSRKKILFNRVECVNSNIPTKLYKFVLLIFLALLFVNLNQILGSRSIFQIEDQEFAQQGVVGHVGELIVFFIIFYIASFKEKSFRTNKLISIMLLAILLMFKIIMAVKAQVVIPFVASFLFLLVRGYIKIKIKTVLLGSLFIFTLFTIPAVIYNTKEDSFDYVVSYFFWYLFAGISGLTGFLSNNPNVQIGASPEVLTQFFNNVFSVLFGIGTVSKNGGEVLEYSEIYTPHAVFPHGSNVFTLFGEVFINSGYIITALYFLIVGYISYAVYLRHKKHLILTLLYVYLGSGLVMSFFSSYILGQPFYEMCAFSYLMYLLAKYTKPHHNVRLYEGT